MIAALLGAAYWVAGASFGCNYERSEPEEVTTDFETTNLARDWRREVIYQLMVDRFANGDRGNDYRVDEGSLGRYQGGDWQGLIDRADYLSDLGVTAVWISPVVRNVETDAGFDGYHGYWTQDFLDVNPHFGDIATLRRMVDELHDRGILVILDVVVNHVGQLFYYDINNNGRPDETLAGTGTRSPLTRVSEWDPDFDIRGIQAHTSLGESGPAPIRFVDMPSINRVPPEPPEFANPDWYWGRGRVTVWGREAEACQLVGIDPASNWDECFAYVRLQEETGDFPGGLKDLRTDLPEVREALIRVASHWIDAIDIDGFRIDTVKHVEHDFWAEFAPAVRSYARQVGKENFFMFGEAFDGQDWLLGSYTAPGMLDSVFYFSQKFRVYDGVFKFGAPTSEIEALWTERAVNYSDVPQPGGVTDRDGRGVPPTKLLVNFLDNHDTPRFLFDALRATGGDRDAAIAMLHNAMALQMTQDGIPCLYYGTEQAFDGGNDPANREPLWWSGYDRTGETYRWTRSLIALRTSLPELQLGTSHIHWSTERTGVAPDAGIFAFERRYRGRRVMVVVNASPTKESVTSAEELGFNRMTTTFAPGTELVDVMPGQGGERYEIAVTDEGCDTVACEQPVPDDYDGAACGCLSVTVPPMSTRVLMPADDELVPPIARDR